MDPTIPLWTAFLILMGSFLFAGGMMIGIVFLLFSQVRRSHKDQGMIRETYMTAIHDVARVVKFVEESPIMTGDRPDAKSPQARATAEQRLRQVAAVNYDQQGAEEAEEVMDNLKPGAEFAVSGR